jgi:hypothetical protein
MSVHTLCDKCGKVIDKNEPYSQLTVTGVQEEIDGGVTVITTAVSYDYHTNHLPKLSKSNLDDSMTAVRDLRRGPAADHRHSGRGGEGQVDP